MALRAITFDAYGTLIRNDVFEAWIDGYFAATQQTPFRRLREIQHTVLSHVLHRLGVDADAAPYVELFFELTTKVELYPEVPGVPPPDFEITDLTGLLPIL